MSKEKQKISKIKRAIAGFLILINLGNYLGYLPLQEIIVQKALAQAENQVAQQTVTNANPADTESHNKLGIIAILVEDGLMNDFDVRGRVMTYANSAQERIAHSKAVVIEVGRNESTFRIASMLEKLYFEGIDTDLIDGNPLNNNAAKEDANQLIGVVMIGNIPIPVVHEENGTAAPSVYPYTDFYRKKYIYNHASDQFEINGLVSDPNPEVWHGLIVPPSKNPDTAKQQLIDYLNKNYEYSTGNPEFADFEKRALYANFPEMEKQTNFLDYKNYLRYLKYMEEMAMFRFNKHLLKEMLKEVSADMGSPDTPIMDDASIASMFDVHTETIFKKYAVNLAEAVKIYRSGINESIKKTGRWSSAEVDSPESLITLRDEYAKGLIKQKQLVLEKKVNDFVKNNLSAAARLENVVTQAELNVKLKILDLEADSNTFTFMGYFDGQLAKDLFFSQQCGIQAGQKRTENQSVLENNSVLVKANRMYNPATLIKPPDDEDWVLEDDLTYKAYGGCVFNNSIAISETGNHPGKCIPELAFLPIYDIVGSREFETEEATAAEGRCDVGKMTFKLPFIELYASDAAENIIPPVIVDESLAEVIARAYSDFQGNNPAADPVTKGSYVIQKLIAGGQTYSYELFPGTTIELSVSTQSKPVDTLYAHVEPTNETIKAIKHIGDPRIDPSTGEVKFPQITTPSTPTDGIRYLSFAKNGIKQIFNYLNLFRIQGNNSDAVWADLTSKLNQKQTELDLATGVTSTLHQDFFAENTEMIEPILWRAESIDQKLAEIIPKYTDKNSFMPSPNYNPKKSPQNKPEGYEVLHIVADGDAQGYQFGLNRAMMAKAPGTEAQQEEDTGTGTGTDTGAPEAGQGGGEGGGEEEGNFICGDPAGVEIWEWFDALQCWIDEEILPAQELFAMTQSCSSAPVPPEEEEVEDPLATMIASASDFDVEMKRKSLVPEQTENIKVTALDAQGAPVLGYIDTPVHFELSNPDVGTFAVNDVYLYSGEKEVEFTAKEPGDSTVTVTMGNLPERTFTINVYNEINVKWGAAEAMKNGRSEFTINVGLKAGDNTDILNVNGPLLLAPEQPADGGFENGGSVEMANGKGQIKFIPAPGKKAVTLISKDPFFDQPPFIIHPTGNAASQIILRAPSFIPIGKDAEIEVIAADDFGFPAEDFNKQVSVQLDEKSKNYATLINPNVSLTKGKGALKISGGKETGTIALTATHEGLKKGKAELPLLARVDSASWKNTYPQTLFASFVGFPAGDFTQQDYFGGTHLFAGKTEAVYSFLTAPAPEPTLVIAPNHLVTTSGLNQTVFVEFPGNQMLLQVFDQKTMQTLMSKRVNLNFDAVKKYDGDAPMPGQMMVETLDADHVAIENRGSYEIKNLKDEVIARLQPNKVQILDPTFRWVYQTDPEFNAIELTLTDGLTNAARVLLALKPESLKAESFDEIAPSLKWQTVYGGKSTNDPTGLSFAEVNAAVPETVREEFYGITGQQKYISLFASGTNIGDAIKFKMPVNAILLGDPTIKLQTKSLSSLNYNSATGQQIYEDPESKQIASINHFNFNNDGYQDVALLTEDGRVKLLEGGPTEPPYKDRGTIAFLVDGGVALEALDLKKDNYEDLLVATDEGRLAILNNDVEVITRSDQKLNIGKKMYSLLKGDMDQDGYADLVILDSRGDIYIFYYNPFTGKFPENGQWIANYGYTLKLADNLNTDLDIRYSGMPEPAQPSTPGADSGTQTAPVTTGPKPALENFDLGEESSVNENAALQMILNQILASKAAAKDPAAAIQSATEETPKLPWPEDKETETYFAPIESIGALNVIKKVANKDRPEAKNVDLEETLTYTIEVNSGVTLNNVVLADTVPDSLTFMPDSVTCVQGDCENVKALQNSVRVFFSGVNLKPGQKMVISYDAFVAHTPAANMMVSRITEPNQYLPNPVSIIDNYLDVLVSPPYNNTGKMVLHYSTGPRSYAVTQSNDPAPPPSDETTKATEGYASLMNLMKIYENGDFNEDNPPPELKMGNSFGKVLDQITGNNDCYENADDAASGISCFENTLDDIGAAIADFQCIGGGCFPMPFNWAFLVPSKNFPIPIFAFPTTLPSPVGPMPFIWPGSLLGAASIPGPIMSQLRFYLSPTLTGGIGIAMCWGPYPTVPTVPPPVWPIPYPPPIGNCMVTALPVDDMFGGLCSLIADGMKALMDLIASGVNKINSAVNDINNNPNIPANIQQGGSGQGAGGMEISLAVNLGNSMKFEPPAKGFSNTHIPAFDSLGGVLSSWFDRQTLEIKNKLLTLPTFTIFLPDVKSLFTLDFEKTKKKFEQWKNTMSGSAAATLDSMKKIGETPSAPGTEGQTVGQQIRGGLQVVKGGKALQYMQAAEKQASIYNLNALEGLYDAASTLPLVKLTEKPIQLNIPWLSAAEIQAWILQAQNWVIYYEREYARVKDIWEKISCQDQPDATDPKTAAENTNNCIARHIAESFGVNFDPLIKSVKDNIEVLQSYLNFPKQLVKFKQQLAGYIKSVACMINVVGQMMGGWMATIRQQIISWAELILTIVEIIKNIADLFDLFINFDADCDICTNERWANFGWWMLLGLILPDIPIITFPKIPDIVLDMSNLNALLDIELPILNIRPVSIPLPPLPYIRLPDLPTISILLTLPPLPVLPKLPELPDLPPLPPLPTVDLPTLPAPPKLPDIGQAFEFIIPIIQKILEIWCIMKKSFAPVPEMSLADQVTLLTNRPAYLIPLDLLKIQLPNIALFDLGFNELRIETVIYLGLKLNVVSKPLEELAATWNGWMAEIPKAMNEAYTTYLEYTEKKIQEELDEIEAKMAEGAQAFEEAFDEYVQGWIDKNVGDPMAEADAWLRNKEQEWQKWSDENGIKVSYEDYYNFVNNTYKKIRESTSVPLKEWFEDHSDFIHALNYLMPLNAVLEIADEEHLGDKVQEALDFVAEKLKESETTGPTQIQRLYACIRFYSDCRSNEAKYFGNTQSSATNNADLPKENKLIAQALPVSPAPQTSSPQISEKEYAKKMLETPQGQQIKSLVTQMSEILKEVNEREPVDYTVLKKQLGVPDYEFAPRPTAVDKLTLMERELNSYGDRLLAEADGQKNIKDLNAIAGVAPLNTAPFSLAETSETPTDEETRVFTSALPPKESAPSDTDPVSQEFMELQKTVEQTTAQNAVQEAPAGGLQGSCRAAVCLPDPVTKSPVPVIPYIDLLATSETLFMPNGHIIYNDGTGLYLKRDLTVTDEDKNTDTGNPRRFEFNEMTDMLRMAKNPKEAVNMFQTTFTEDGASTFTWLPSTHPEVYGYGIELERTITGYDPEKQNNQLPDTKIILLPPDGEGVAPEVLAGKQKIDYGTLVTSLTDKEAVAARFGIDPRNIVTGAKDIRFPTINNALIKLNENKAVYFDQMNGSAYSMNMENGYYQIKMTWFSNKADTATYNENEILAPQVYAGAAEPIDVSQKDTYYMPVFKEKKIKASDIFVDLAGVYKYYWFINPESNQLTPITGNTLTIPPQKEAKKFKVKLVATQNIEDESFEPFEKTFEVVVYVPSIALDSKQLNEGIIAGNMKPIEKAKDDDLSELPFSVFRKRLGTWKNLGILKAKNSSQTTQPPLGAKQSYYSVDQNGTYYIEGFDILEPSPMIFEDNNNQPVAEVSPETGLIILKDPNYEITAVPAGTDTPTHIAIVKKDTKEILGNVFYVAESATDVTMVSDSLNMSNVKSDGVTVGDANSGDDIIAGRIPKDGPSFPGGVAIFEKTPQANVALVDTDGTIRMMKADYSLKIKNPEATEGHYIFQIADDKGKAVYDIFIQADFENLQVSESSGMNDLNTQIGLLPNTRTLYAQADTQSSTETQSPPVPEFQLQSEAPLKGDESPFPDVDKTHPYYQQIIDLYKDRVISGYADGSFKPDQPLTRAEYVKIALGVTNCVDCSTPTQPQKEKYSAAPFPDVNLPSWYYYCISIAKELGMVTGYGDGLFRPDRQISRAEAAAILIRQAGIELVEAPEKAFLDVPDYAWYVDYVYTAVQIGLIKANFGLVNPDQAITRGEFAFMAAGVKDMMACRLVDSDKDGNPDWWEQTHNTDMLTSDAEKACPCFNSPWTADTDKDGKKDVCDLDIDNDGILNPMCILTDTGQVDNNLLTAGIATLGERSDNCIFTPNPDQSDANDNGIGDLCDAAAVLCPCADNPNQNDTDKDGVRDVCDDDIDNDGIKQTICAFDDNGLLDLSKLTAGDDNCVFAANSDQADTDKNGAGDICQLEVTDICPEVPEDLDGVDDEDGCPELSDAFPGHEPGVYVTPGELCSFVDFATDMKEGDTFMTAITDLETHEVLHSKSGEIIFSKE